MSLLIRILEQVAASRDQDAFWTARSGIGVSVLPLMKAWRHGDI